MSSALVRQTEAELVAQAAVWAAAFRAELRRTAPGPAPPAGAGLGRTEIDLLSHPGLDLARDPVLPEPPDPVPGPPAEPRAAAIGAALAPMVRDAQAVTLSALRITDANGTVVATNVGGEGLNLRAKRRSPACAAPRSCCRTMPTRFQPPTARGCWLLSRPARRGSISLSGACWSWPGPTWRGPALPPHGSARSSRRSVPATGSAAWR